MTRRLFKIGITVSVLLICLGTAIAQVANIPTPPEVKRLLDENNVTEAEFQAAMLQRGYDPNNIDIETVDLDELERVSLEVINELSAQKEEEAQNAVNEAAQEAGRESAERIQTAIEEGASTDEAVAEELQQLASPEPESDEDISDEIFGHQLFRNQALNVYRQADRIKPPDSYVVGVGDELSITINGLSQASIVATVDRDGFISISEGGPKPPIPVRGLTIAQTEDLLKRRLKTYFNYNDNQFRLTVLTARTITVNFFGEIQTTGGITLSAVNTLFNAVVAAGGPTDIGSVRNIRLISGEEDKVFDTYAYMRDPKLAQDFYLNDNDYVHIPVAQRVVRISGAVRRPYRYELLEDENLVQLIDYAGGLTDAAYLKDIQITRFRNDQRVVINVNLREILDSEGDYLLEPGDEVVIQSIEQAVENFVEIQGALIKPGKYERKDGMRLSDLIDMGILDRTARTDFGYLLRRNPDGRYTYVRIDPSTALSSRGSASDVVLQDMDIVRITSQAQYSDEVEFHVNGAVRSPGLYGFDPSGALSIQDAILISGGLKPSASDFGYVLRRSADQPESADYIPFNPRVALTDPSSNDNILLSPLDSVVIFDVNDLRDEFFILIAGAVRKPGLIRYDTDLTLQQAIRLAGGLSFSAASNRVDVSRVVIAENQPTRTVNYSTEISSDLNTGQDDSMLLMPFDRVYVRDVPQFELQRTVTLRGEVVYPGEYALIKENEKLASLIERAGGLTLEAYSKGATLVRSGDIGPIVINLDQAIANENSSANITFSAGDVLEIPKQPDLVTISGAVNLRDFYSEEFIARGNRINVAYEKGKNAKYYVDNFAAGIAEDGRKKLITVEQASGKIERTKNFLFFRIYPKVEKGATVNVGRVEPRPESTPTQKEDVDWGKVATATLAQATAILTLILLVDRL